MDLLIKSNVETEDTFLALRDIEDAKRIAEAIAIMGIREPSKTSTDSQRLENLKELHAVAKKKFKMTHKELSNVIRNAYDVSSMAELDANDYKESTRFLEAISKYMEGKNL